ncbi:UDP-4-amino-4,6-dideoxy-N-acetyl-beta-L-altrosamine transaminase [Pseudomaricurvus alkylphenolicus]|uniref:UDP-4-amino-4, 6-dideoxy-N-acetyl-beta-L-altrosamine transaminase n=1 Tax=Pseudomaricurvus alkylphenolicus TaxID=1306991 RepID=UPI001423067A|nr:UDP-4-amino-4,6-dideoxy-N-acetyl-beta-L-altrosamine transaminase [Pseudomaricurvus alkylphenolicus]NIB43243.1 UDP-4-amino-4,6-dideoxy-N-acetyl-beta-L-altrosamine transaminase [Pseudomaricurvus alkylphenolicus]
MIPYGKQTVTDEDIASVVEVLKSDWLTQGPTVPRFEQALADYTGASHCAVVSNGTAALHLACLALELGPGDWLWTSPISFLASANCGLYCGAQVDFVDIDPADANICPKRLSEKLERAQKCGRLPKAVVAVHMAGNPCQLKEIRELLHRYEVSLIEDACHAIGARYDESRIGDCRYSDITVFSFHPVKVITSGEGGALLTNSDILNQRIRQLREHGICRDPQNFIQTQEGAWYYEQQELGWNYRLTDLQAALGLSQLSRCDEAVAERNRIAQIYDQLLSELPLDTLKPMPGQRSSYHLYIIKVAEEKRAGLFAHLRSSRIGAQVHYIPIHTQPSYQKLGFSWGDFPAAESYYRQTLSLPIFPGLSEAEQDHVVASVRDFLS